MLEQSFNVTARDKEEYYITTYRLNVLEWSSEKSWLCPPATLTCLFVWDCAVEVPLSVIATPHELFLVPNPHSVSLSLSLPPTVL